MFHFPPHLWLKLQILNLEKLLNHFYDYRSRIADVVNGKIVAVYPDWDYSKSTSRHFNAFLNEFVVGGWSIAEMTKKQKEKYFEENNLLKELP